MMRSSRYRTRAGRYAESDHFPSLVVRAVSKASIDTRRARNVRVYRPVQHTGDLLDSKRYTEDMLSG